MQRHDWGRNMNFVPKKMITTNGIDHLLSKSTLKNDKMNQVLTDDIVNYVYSTFDYSKFRLIFGNRKFV